MESRSNVAKEKCLSSKVIRKKVKNSETIALKRYKIDTYNLLDLDKVFNDVYCAFRPVSAEYVTRKELVNNLNAMALEIFGNSEETSPVLEAYGSFVMDMFSPKSDLDVSINFGKGTSELSRQKKLQVLERFADKLGSLESAGHVRNVNLICTARVPIVKFTDQGTDIECDLSVDNKDGILNSQIIRIISQIDDRFQKLCVLVKHWAQAHDVNSALHRTLNSVSLASLVAFHLQTQSPPILPPFSFLFKDGIDPPNVEKRTQKFLNWGRRNQESLGRLFATFFIKLQSVEFLWRKGLCVSVLNGLWISKKWRKAVVGSISVEDFIDVSQNLSRRVNDKGAKKIYSSINKTVEDIFDFLDGKVTGTHLSHKLFGRQATVIPPYVPSLNGKIAGLHPEHRVFSQQVVVEPPPPVPSFSGKIAGIQHRLFGQQAAVEPLPPVPSLGGRIAGTYLERRVFGEQALVEPPPAPFLSGKIAGMHPEHRVFGQQAAVEPPPVRLLSGKIVGTHPDHRVFGQQALVGSPPPVPFRNGLFAGRLFGQQTVVEPPTVPSSTVYPQPPHNSYMNEYSGPPVENHNKRAFLGNGYRAFEGTGHQREEEKYEDLRRKRRRYVEICYGFEESREIPRFRIHKNKDPLDDPYRQVPLTVGANCHLVLHRGPDGRFKSKEPMPAGLWEDYNRRIGQPPPPNDRVTYETFGPQNFPKP